MFRLTAMILACLVAIWLAMAMVTPGRQRPAPDAADDSAASRTAPAAEPAAESVPLLPLPAPPTEKAAVAGPSASALAPDAQGEDVADNAPAEPAPARYRDDDMPGPPLQPSPQYPDRVAPVADGGAGEATPPAEAAGQRRVTAARVNLRAGPGTGHAVIGAVSEGELVRPLAPAADGWQQIRTETGETGYLAEQFLSDPQ